MKNLDGIFKAETKGEVSLTNQKGYTMITTNGEAVMYDLGSVLSMYKACIPEFKGDVLVVGLGLGLLGQNFRHQCDSFDYLELTQGIIDLVSPYDTTCNYFQGDAYEWATDKKYDVIFLDIHHKESDTRVEELLVLKDKYSCFLKPGGTIGHFHVAHKKIF
jgi:spermidine synthase